MELVRYEVDGGVARVTLDSPHNRNALSATLMRETLDSLRQADEDTDVRAVVLTAEGHVFCAGADLKGDDDGGDGDGPKPVLLPDLLLQLWRMDTPVIGRINGAARGGGLGLVAACDIAVTHTDATFAFTEVRLGVVPAMIAPFVLDRLAPRAATELFLTGDRFDGARAAEVGLVNRAVPQDELDDAVDGYLASIVRGAPSALALAKGLRRRIGNRPPEDVLDEMQELSLERFASEEAAEGITAFMEKRDAAWVPQR